MKRLWPLCLLMGLGCSSAWAGSITIDGDLKDWIGPPQGKASDWTPIRSTTLFQVEDQGGNNNTYLDPGYGGQAYDAEAVYLEIADAHLNVAIVTGLNPNNTEWKPGDIAIDFGNNGSFEYGIVTSGPESLNDSHGSGIGSRGDVYGVTAWNVGLWGDSVYKNRHPTSVRNGNLLNSGQPVNLSYGEAKYDGKKISELSATLGSFGGPHYLIEAAIPIYLFGTDWGQKFTLHWTMACANDWIAIDPPAQVSEPGSLGLLGLGLVGLLGRKRLGTRTN